MVVSTDEYEQIRRAAFDSHVSMATFCRQAAMRRVGEETCQCPGMTALERATRGRHHDPGCPFGVITPVLTENVGT